MSALDAINVVFNVFVASVLVIGAFGLAIDVELPDAEAAKSEGFTKKLSHPRPTADPLEDVCKLPVCGDAAPSPPSFVETKDTVVIPAPKPASARPLPTAAKTQESVPATLKHGDDHPSKHSKRGWDDRKDKDAGERAKDLREKAEERAQKSLEKAREQARKALDEQRKERDDRDEDRDDDEHDEDEDDD